MVPFVWADTSTKRDIGDLMTEQSLLFDSLGDIPIATNLFQ